MLNKKQVYQLLRDREWILKQTTPDTEVPGFMSFITSLDDPRAFFSIEFKDNGRLEFPTGIKYVPVEYGGWDFNEETQKLIFVSRDGQSNLRADLPQKLPYGIMAFKIYNDYINPLYFFVNYPHIDQEQVTSHCLGGTKAFFLPRSAYDKGFYQTLRWTGFNTNLVDHEDDRVAMLTEIYDYLAYHPQIEQVVFSQTNQPVVQLPEKQHLLFTLESGQPSLDYFSGTRAAIMELLTLIISENNLRLYNDADQRDETTMLQDVIANCFTGRYEVIDSLPEATTLWQILLHF
ncbi:hypothetical protein GBO93_03830 [Pediococcus acidilactici]|uniref:hypothetical protein n=1 Tax=Pediococcus acidilactici TaxID=1254 RepID=UPI001321DA60|nr:hypothetical protein [Pediococcus acidilactici]KAF0336631.1 hypothetical protein GBO20_01595 [Pediococcus acidilactici]KAF0337337.1 hypothetical protein GBO39_06105 [Pediococcus acidilactici]KAF0345506.1 hypothetical protein GBO43_04135 [Pediococcus acidilactici]KAF0349214.1 hypothetical protein GBO45_05325 [Pediococcus acidilactici]KAF0355057.1 hypothetical protein GBO47_03420 [Pediococcus acidilactici]